MADSRPPADEPRRTASEPGGARPLSPDALLPPVEPPSAGFLVQLFLVPAVIVAIIVGIWLCFHWIAHLGQDPQAYVKTLRRDNEGRWQAALNLANELRGPGGAALKADATLATELGRILTDEAKSGRTGEQSRMLRLYLCRALGEFSIPEALPALVEQIGTQEPQVARSAVEAVAVLAANLAEAGRPAPGADAIDAVLGASRTSDASLRSAAAFTLGVVAGKDAPAAVDRLGVLLGDADDDVRYNAALGLARLGDRRSITTLGEMLALPDEPGPIDPLDEQAQSRRYKRVLVVRNALRGLAFLVDASPEPLPDDTLGQVKGLAKDAVSDIRTAAGALEKKLERVAPAG